MFRNSCFKESSHSLRLSQKWFSLNFKSSEYNKTSLSQTLISQSSWAQSSYNSQTPLDTLKVSQGFIQFEITKFNCIFYIRTRITNYMQCVKIGYLNDLTVTEVHKKDHEWFALIVTIFNSATANYFWQNSILEIL
jgi:hypothetical protein